MTGEAPAPEAPGVPIHERITTFPRELQLAYLLGVCVRTFGHDTTARFYARLRPLVEDKVGHGHALAPGDAPDPAENFWGGVWRIHRAD